MGWIVSHSKHFIFIHIPKTAGSSIGDPKYRGVKSGALVTQLKEGDEAHQGHIQAWRLKKQLGDVWNDYYKFCFVRNPWDRCLSAYIYYHKAVSSLLSRIPFTGEYWKRRSNLGRQILACSDFHDFCQNIDKFSLDLHFAPQVDYACDENGKLLVDFVGRFENLDADLLTITTHIGVPPLKLPHYRKSGARKYQRYYNADARESIREKYARDIKLFGYEF